MSWMWLALKKILGFFWNTEFIQIRLEDMCLLKSRDDLVLDGAIDQLIPLVGTSNQGARQSTVKNWSHSTNDWLNRELRQLES